MSICGRHRPRRLVNRRLGRGDSAIALSDVDGGGPVAALNDRDARPGPCDLRDARQINLTWFDLVPHPYQRTALPAPAIAEIE